jgi:DNA-binding MarR family transcriptional regulator
MTLATDAREPRRRSRSEADEPRTPQPDAPFEGARIHHLNQGYGEKFAEFAAAAKVVLTVPQLMLLWAIETHAGGSQTTMVEMSGIDRSTVAEMVRRLAKRKYLERRRTKEDARAYAVKLTEDGKALLRQGKVIAAKADKAIAALQRTEAS